MSRHADIPMAKPLEDEPTIKRSTFRLEADLIDRLHTFCRQQGLSREVLIEAMYEYMEAHPGALTQVVEQASQKHDHRQQLANRKRAEAMFSKFGRDA
ncbi:CopG family transcriptional regulator [Nodosilinea sp. LEGE 06152]|uniref:CopG family transcriptional regulator n=1 Tax=Nodosilinea sp. LEGE 06152 TaxID=2777966 RepID=UPI00187FB3AF|nr:CopG family transcriptional regulator [Nodosilinea sp. LEGE 06152]MBE9160362.1 CopG family transcriptional regulator [Nodosilinea sp. LEGE 06152]